MKKENNNFMKKLSFLLLFISINANAIKFNVYNKQVNQINFRIDPRIELFNIIAMQMGHNGMTLNNIDYKQSCIDYFSKYKNHPASSILMETWQKGWGVDAPMFFLLSLDKDFKISNTLDKGIIDTGGGLEQLNKLAKSMKDFAEVSNFQQFFNEVNKPLYHQILNQVDFNFRDFKGVSYLQGYYGKKADEYNVYLNLIGGYGNFGNSFKQQSKLILNVIIETPNSSSGIPVFEPNISTIDLLFHEFSHGYINPLVDAHLKEIEQYAHLYEPIKESMQSQGYQDWRVTLIEHLVRTAVVRITDNFLDTNLSKNVFYKLEKTRRFIYADHFQEKLKVYEQNRMQFNTLDSFFKELIKDLYKIDASYIEKQQNQVEIVRQTNINKIKLPNEFALDETTLFVIPTHEENKEDQQQIHEFVKQYRDMFSEKIQIIIDDEVLNLDISKNDIVVFGTIRGNSFLRKHHHLLPIQINEKSIITNKILKGDNFQVVTSWVNPQNPDKLFAIYTAQKAKDVNNYHFSPSKGNYHYWIAINTIAIDVGNFQYYSTWMPNIFRF